MIVINSSTYGQIVLPQTGDDGPKINYPVAISEYSRDNTSNNTRDSVSTGAVKQMPTLTCEGVCSDVQKYSEYITDPVEAYVKISNIIAISELLSVTINFEPDESQSTPETFSNVSIKNFSWCPYLLNSFKYTIEFGLVILTNETYNSTSINVPQGTASLNGSTTDQQYKSTKATNSGYAAVNSSSTTITTVTQQS